MDNINAPTTDWFDTIHKAKMSHKPTLMQSVGIAFDKAMQKLNNNFAERKAENKKLKEMYKDAYLEEKMVQTIKLGQHKAKLNMERKFNIKNQTKNQPTKQQQAYSIWDGMEVKK